MVKVPRLASLLDNSQILGSDSKPKTIPKSHSPIKIATFIAGFGVAFLFSAIFGLFVVGPYAHPFLDSYALADEQMQACALTLTGNQCDRGKVELATKLVNNCQKCRDYSSHFVITHALANFAEKEGIPKIRDVLSLTNVIAIFVTVALVYLIYDKLQKVGGHAQQPMFVFSAPTSLPLSQPSLPAPPPKQE